MVKEKIHLRSYLYQPKTTEILKHVFEQVPSNTTMRLDEEAEKKDAKVVLAKNVMESAASAKTIRENREKILETIINHDGVIVLDHSTGLFPYKKMGKGIKKTPIIPLNYGERFEEMPFKPSTPLRMFNAALLGDHMVSQFSLNALDTSVGIAWKNKGGEKQIITHADLVEGRIIAEAWKGTIKKLYSGFYSPCYERGSIDVTIPSISGVEKQHSFQIKNMPLVLRQNYKKGLIAPDFWKELKTTCNCPKRKGDVSFSRPEFDKKGNPINNIYDLRDEFENIYCKHSIAGIIMVAYYLAETPEDHRSYMPKDWIPPVYRSEVIDVDQHLRNKVLMRLKVKGKSGKMQHRHRPLTKAERSVMLGVYVVENPETSVFW